MECGAECPDEPYTAVGCNAARIVSSLVQTPKQNECFGWDIKEILMMKFFPLTKRGLSVLACCSALAGSGVLTFAQTADDEPEPEDVVTVVQAVPQRAPDPADKRDTAESRKDREALRKRRAELERELERINRELGEPVIRIRRPNGSDNFSFNFNDDYRRELEAGVRAGADARRKAQEEISRAREEMSKAQKEMSKADRERMRAGLEASRKALESLKLRGDKDSDNLRFFYNKDGKAWTIPPMPELPRGEFFADGKAFVLPRGEFNSKEFESAMRRFEQKMEAWQKDFETKFMRRMKEWEEKQDRRPEE
jgi:hypothetical protein